MLVVLSNNAAHARILKLGLASLSGIYEVADSVPQALQLLISIPTVSVLAIAPGVSHEVLADLNNALNAAAWSGRRLRLIVGCASSPGSLPRSRLLQVPPNIETLYFETRNFYSAVKAVVTPLLPEYEERAAQGKALSTLESESQLRWEVLAVRRQLGQIASQLEELAGVVSHSPVPSRSGHEVLTKERQLVLLELMRQLDAVRLSKLEGHLECQPVWSILAELYQCQLLQREVSVTDVCLESGVPMTTALRKLEGLIEGGWVIRMPNVHDRRRVNAVLSDVGSRLVRKVLAAFNEAFKTL